MIPNSASSSAMRQRPKPSPRSELRSSSMASLRLGCNLGQRHIGIDQAAGLDQKPYQDAGAAGDNRPIETFDLNEADDIARAHPVARPRERIGPCGMAVKESTSYWRSHEMK